MTVAARQIDWEAWSQSRFLDWAETQPEGCRYEFARFPASRDGPSHGWPQPDRAQHQGGYPPQVARRGTLRRLWTAGCDRNSRRRHARAGRIHRVFQAAPERGRLCRRLIVIFEVVSPGAGNRRRDEEKVDEYGMDPSILRYVVVESESRSFRAFWREPGEQAWHREAPDAALPNCLPEFGIDLTIDEVYSGSTSIEVGGFLPGPIERACARSSNA